MAGNFNRNKCIDKLRAVGKHVYMGWTDKEMADACGCEGDCSTEEVVTKPVAEEVEATEVELVAVVEKPKSKKKSSKKK